MKKELLILSGFLGSGKTTFLFRLLPQLANKKVALLLNDFGEIPVDGAILKEEGIEAGIISEIGGGSVFCSCLKGSFLEELKRFSERDEDILVVEASGMSDPSLIDKMLVLSGLDNVYDHSATICIFDPVKSLKLSKVIEVIPRQLAAASVAVLSKCDMYSPEEIDKARDYILQQEKTLPVIRSDEAIALNNLPGRSFRKFTFGFNTPENRPDNLTLTRIDCQVDDFIELIRDNRNILRLKGYIKAEDGCWFLSDTGEKIITRKEKDCAVPLSIICMQGTSDAVRKTIERGVQSAK